MQGHCQDAELAMTEPDEVLGSETGAFPVVDTNGGDRAVFDAEREGDEGKAAFARQLDETLAALDAK